MGGCCSATEFEDNYPCEVRYNGKWYRATTQSHTGSAQDGSVRYTVWIRALGMQHVCGDNDVRGITTDTESSDYAELVL
jgi:hypothetical protein